MALTLPPDTIVAAIHGSVTRITQHVDVYEADGVTPFMLNAKITEGSVNVSASRDERRTCDLTLANTNGDLSPGPNGFWYDKVLKVYRGIYTKTETWETQLGEFYIDGINRGSFPNTVRVSTRDATKLLLKAKFAASTEYPINTPIENIVQAIASNGGITKFALPLTGKSSGKAYLFERQTERWKAITEICTAYGYDVYFRPDGYLTMEAFKDPSNAAVSPSEYTFEVGGRMVRNGGFETLTDATSAAWWTKNFEMSGAQTQTIETDPMHVRAGRYALKMVNVGNVGGAVASESIAVSPGEVWELSMFSKANVIGGGKYFRILFGTTKNFGRNDAGVAYTDIVGNGVFTAEYTQDIGRLVVPAGVQWMRLAPYAWANGASYTAWFDTITAKRIQPDPSLDTKGNLVSFEKATADARLYNHIVVTGERSDQVPVYAEAENNNASSPTRIARIGRRTFFYTSSFIETVAQAQAVADAFLDVHALEQYEVSLEALVVPYLTVNIIVTFDDPDGVSTDPVRYLLSDLTFPLGGGAMSGSLKRVTAVG